MTMTDTTTVYMAAPEYETPLVEELQRAAVPVLWQRGRLVGAAGEAIAAAWAQDIWYSPVFLPITSIGDGAAKLRGIQRNWALYSIENHRRAALIQEKLPKIKKSLFVFGDPAPQAPLGGWTLWEPDMILASARKHSPFPNGELAFVENRVDPPSRAYLKLWEVFTLLGTYPQPGETCLDLGSCPGGWTWVLATLGARVISLDKAPLAPQVAAMPTVEYRSESAFGYDPRHAEPIDWLCCDVACYPSRLLGLITRWLEQGVCRNYVCTLKFQGETDHDTAAAFAAIPGSRLMHLAHNKHELTWVLLNTR